MDEIVEKYSRLLIKIEALKSSFHSGGEGLPLPQSSKQCSSTCSEMQLSKKGPRIKLLKKGLCQLLKKKKFAIIFLYTGSNTISYFFIFFFHSVLSRAARGSHS